MAGSNSSRETYIQKIVLLLLPVVGVIALRGITLLRHSPGSANTTTNTSEQVTAANQSQQEISSQLQKYLAGAIEAVNNGNYAEAKSEYNKFYAQWTKTEESFKERSRENYDEMEKGIDQVKRNLIDAATPDKNSTVAGLQQLTRTLDNYSSNVPK